MAYFCAIIPSRAMGFTLNLHKTLALSHSEREFSLRTSNSRLSTRDSL
ncbi:hypothetical protein H6F32_06260 [Anabaena sp. FACHB-1237]|nr:hypothetical protein [Anabaena sp. FACHB-1237]MBD2137195.1 hypothetical protein [Anabaena sp. FACHB-1237]